MTKPVQTLRAHERGRLVFEEESRALMASGDRLGAEFDSAIDTIMACKGRVVLTGMGKHGLIARKVAATLASTGTPAFFMHPAEGLHGDLGMIDPSDVVIAVSNSGNTSEVLHCVPFFKRNGNRLIAMTGNRDSELARQADIILDVCVDREVCPLNLAPTTSTTVALAMGDALAVVLLEKRQFKADDFALRHPSGALGRRLLLRVSDVVSGTANPVIEQDRSLKEAIQAVTAAGRGAVSVVDGTGALVGIVTDGDIRRIWERTGDKTVAEVHAWRISDVMTKSPLSITPDMLAAKAISVMEHGNRKVLVLPVVDASGKPVAMLQLHDLVAAGV
jgi:arabinose-5-phosphate isomerase